MQLAWFTLCYKPFREGAKAVFMVCNEFYEFPLSIPISLDFYLPLHFSFSALFMLIKDVVYCGVKRGVNYFTTFLCCKNMFTTYVHCNANNPSTLQAIRPCKQRKQQQHRGMHVLSSCHDDCHSTVLKSHLTSQHLVITTE